MFGIQEEDPDVRAAVGRVEVVQAEIEEVKRAMRDVPFLEMFDAHGKPLKDEEADDERAVKYQECSEQKEQFEKKSVTQRLFLNVSELQLRVDGVGASRRPRRCRQRVYASVS